MTSLQVVAQQAGVSVSTASRVLNGTKLSDRISEQCAERVRLVAQQVGYTGGYHRRVLRSGRAEVLGVALEQNAPTEQPLFPSSIGGAFYGQIVAGVERATHAAGYNLSLIVPSRHQRANQRGLEHLVECRIDGLILPPCNLLPENTRLLREAPLRPIVAVQPPLPTELPVVTYGGQEFIALAVEHLHALNHRRLLYLGPGWTDEADPIFAREHHFLAAACRLGIQAEVCHYAMPRDRDTPPDPLARAAAREAALSEHLAALADGARPPFTGVVAFNDAAAVSACRVLARRGLRVPQDISVTGVDHTGVDYLSVRLTTIDLPLAELGLRAGQLALEMIVGGEKTMRAQRGQRVVIPPRLVVAESTAPAR